jgi:hypothetical protein
MLNLIVNLFCLVVMILLLTIRIKDIRNWDFDDTHTPTLHGQTHITNLDIRSLIFAYIIINFFFKKKPKGRGVLVYASSHHTIH